jgi:hypothetical protein
MFKLSVFMLILIQGILRESNLLINDSHDVLLNSFDNRIFNFLELISKKFLNFTIITISRKILLLISFFVEIMKSFSFPRLFRHRLYIPLSFRRHHTNRAWLLIVLHPDRIGLFALRLYVWFLCNPKSMLRVNLVKFKLHLISSNNH